MTLTKDEFESAFKNAMSTTVHKVDIAALEVDLTDKFKMTAKYKSWISHFDRLIKLLPNKSNDEKADILLISIGQTAASFYDRATKAENENQYLATRATLENIFCVPQASAEARVIFFGIRPKQNEKTLHLIERLRRAAELCEFEDKDVEIMRVLLSCNTDAKWQEKRFSAKWTEKSLADAEIYARQLEQMELLKKELKDMYSSSSSGNVNRIHANTKCDYCGRSHKKGHCAAYNKRCDFCQRLHHFSSVCREKNNRGKNAQSRGGYRGRGNRRGNFRGNRGRGGTVMDTAAMEMKTRLIRQILTKI